MVFNKIKKISAILFLFLLLYSCNHETNSSEKDAQQSVSPDSLPQNDSIAMRMKALADSLDLAEANYEDLLKSKNGSDYRFKVFYRKLHLLQQENDSLKTILNELEEEISEIDVLSEEQAPPLSQDEKDIRSMIISLNQAWIRMHNTKKPKEVLRFFNHQFMVSWIVIEKDNSANAALYTHNDFGNFLREITHKRELTFEFGDVSFFDIEIKDHKYFKATYKCELRVYKEDVLQYRDSVLVTIAGKKIKDKWKIASYAWIGFKYNVNETENE